MDSLGFFFLFLSTWEIHGVTTIGDVSLLWWTLWFHVGVGMVG